MNQLIQKKEKKRKEKRRKKKKEKKRKEKKEKKRKESTFNIPFKWHFVLWYNNYLLEQNS